MKDVIAKMREAFSDYAGGDASFSSRIRLPAPGGKGYIAMPGVFNRYSLAGLKTYVGNRKGIRHVLVFSTETAEPIAMIESSRMGQLKTGALPAMVTERLVEGRSHNLCLIGSGFQAETQLEGMHCVLDLERVSVYSRSPEHARSFAERMSSKFSLDVRAYDTAAGALKGATVVNAATNSDKPIFFKADLGESWHVNLCGANIPSRREAGEDVLSGSDLVVVEHMEQAMRESSEIMALRSRHPETRCVELRDIMAGDMPEPHGRTVFKSMGVGLEDLAAAASVLQAMDIIQ